MRSIRGCDILAYDTRGKENYRSGWNRTVVFELFSFSDWSSICQSISKFNKIAPKPTALKIYLKTLISSAFHSAAGTFNRGRLEKNSLIKSVKKYWRKITLINSGFQTTYISNVFTIRAWFFNKMNVLSFCILYDFNVTIFYSHSFLHNKNKNSKFVHLYCLCLKSFFA